MNNVNSASMSYDDALSGHFLDRGPRLPVAMPAVIAAAGHDLLDVMITNLSSEGFAVDAPHLILIGSNVTISAPEIGHRRATIRWALGFRMGGRFN